MRKIFLTAATVACAAALAVLLTACKADDIGHKTAASAQSNAATPPEQAKPHADGVRRVTVAELNQMIERGEAIAADVRTKEQYEQGRIKGAIFMPTDELSNRLSELPKDKLIVFYCA